MKKLFENEMYKIFKSKRIYIFCGILAFVALVFSLIVKQVYMAGQFGEDITLKELAVQYPLQLLSTVSDLLLPIFATLMITFLIADEYNEGTLKLSILSGYGRNRIIISKVLAVIVATVIMLVVVYITSYLGSFLAFGSAVIQNDVGYNIAAYIWSLLPLITWIVFNFFLALYIKNSGIIVGVVVGITLVSSILSSMLPRISSYIGTYYLKAIAASFSTINLGMAAVVCLMYMFLFGTVSYVKFIKMDIEK